MFWGEMAMNKRCDLTRGCIGTLERAQIHFAQKEEVSKYVDYVVKTKDEQPILGLFCFSF